MFIDTARIRTIARLDADIKDPKKQTWEKQRAQRLKSKIQRELKDPLLADMRERLTRAYADNNKYEAWKITCQIKDYMHEDIPHDIWVEDEG